MTYQEPFSPMRISLPVRQRYAGLPHGLFDRTCVHKELERVQYNKYTPPIAPSAAFRVRAAGEDARGIAYLEKTGNQVKALIDAMDPKGLDDFITRLKSEFPLTRVTLTVPEAGIGEALSEWLAGNVTGESNFMPIGIHRK